MQRQLKPPERKPRLHKLAFNPQLEPRRQRKRLKTLVLMHRKPQVQRQLRQPERKLPLPRQAYSLQLELPKHHKRLKQHKIQVPMHRKRQV